MGAEARSFQTVALCISGFFQSFSVGNKTEEKSGNRVSTAVPRFYDHEVCVMI